MGLLIAIWVLLITKLGYITETVGFNLTIVLIMVDWLAEMYDPHPDNMGKWFESHFHRVFHDEGED